MVKKFIFFIFSVLIISVLSAASNSYLINRLVLTEGKERYAYVDTLGYSTIGVGRNIDKRGFRGLTDDEIFYLLNNDIKITQDLLWKLPWFKRLNTARQTAITDMCFNMGIVKCLKFKNMIVAMDNKDFELAARCAKNSMWYKQVKSGRADPIIELIRTGDFPPYSTLGNFR